MKSQRAKLITRLGQESTLKTEKVMVTLKYSLPLICFTRRMIHSRNPNSITTMRKKELLYKIPIINRVKTLKNLITVEVTSRAQ